MPAASQNNSAQTPSSQTPSSQTPSSQTPSSPTCTHIAKTSFKHSTKIFAIAYALASALICLAIITLAFGAQAATHTDTVSVGSASSSSSSNGADRCREFNDLKLEGGAGGLSAAALIPRFLELSQAVEMVSRPKRIDKQLPYPDICTGHGTSLVASTDTQILFACENGETLRYFDFGAGTCGFGKREAGDRKTPVGTYSLGSPRHSDQGFGTFIPIGYPTAKQKAQGFSGSDVGIHGPKSVKFRGMTIQVPYTNASSNWTAGCIALDSYALIDELADFVKAHPGMKIHILELSPEPEPEKKSEEQKIDPPVTEPTEDSGSIEKHPSGKPQGPTTPTNTNTNANTTTTSTTTPTTSGTKLSPREAARAKARAQAEARRRQ